MQIFRVFLESSFFMHYFLENSEFSKNCSFGQKFLFWPPVLVPCHSHYHHRPLTFSSSPVGLWAEPLAWQTVLPSITRPHSLTSKA